jgi:hypothetical protein
LNLSELTFQDGGEKELTELDALATLVAAYEVKPY